MINADSSFIYKRNPYIFHGIWYRDQDSLVLVIRECNYINDSIRLLFQKYNLPNYKDQLRKYLVRKNYFIRYLPLKEKGKIVEKLEYVGQ